MSVLRTPADIDAAGTALGAMLAATYGPATQQRVDQWAALKAPWLPQLARPQAA